MADPNDRRTEGAPPREIHIEKDKGFNWLPWLLLALGILALLFALSRCGRHDTAVAPAPIDNTQAMDNMQGADTGGNTVVAQTPGAPNAAPLAGVSGLGAYLGGTEPTPRTFTFERLHFDTAKADLRPQDRDEVTQIATVLKQYGNSRIRIAGYADARGSTPENLKLGKARAEAVKAALVAQGIDGARIETASGGANDPVADNATPQGQAENRRTELVVVQR